MQTSVRRAHSEPLFQIPESCPPKLHAGSEREGQAYRMLEQPVSRKFKSYWFVAKVGIFQLQPNDRTNSARCSGACSHLTTLAECALHIIEFHSDSTNVESFDYGQAGSRYRSYNASCARFERSRCYAAYVSFNFGFWSTRSRTARWDVLRLDDTFNQAFNCQKLQFQFQFGASSVPAQGCGDVIVFRE